MNHLNKLLKRGLLALLLMAFCLITVVYYVSYLSPQARIGQRNKDNSGKIRKNMSIRQVVLIMGMPDDTIAINHDSLRVYHYVSPPGASSEIAIYFKQDGSVSHVVNND